MIRHWYEPVSFSEWLKRAFSIFNILVFFITAIIIFSEFRFNWFERIVGNYLSVINESRPRIGAIWETGKLTSNAHAALNKIVNQQENTRQNIQQAESFSSLASRLLPGQWVSLDKQQFKDLYMALEPSAAVDILEPVKLVWLLNGKRLERIFCEGIDDGIKIYFIDAKNNVIRQISLTHNDIKQIEKNEKANLHSLSEMEGFEGRIYSAERFFSAVFTLPNDMIPDLIQNPEVLLRQEGRMTRVGIWNEAENGYIILGFEFKTGEELKTILLKGREWAVWQLSLNLQGEYR